MAASGSGTLKVEFLVAEWESSDQEFIEYQDRRLQDSLFHELAKHLKDGVECVMRFKREDIPAQGLMTPRLLRHSVDIHLASSLIKQNAELKRQLAALEYQNTLLLSDLPR